MGVLFTTTGLPLLTKAGLPILTTTGAPGRPDTPDGRGALARGWDENYDAGTAASLYVDASRPDDSGDGTSLATAKKTVRAAIDLATTGDVTIAIRAGIYREKVRFSAGSFSSLVLKGYGTDKPLVTGQDSLTGWTRCSGADAAELGPVLGVKDSPIWKTALNLASVINQAALNIYEGEEPVPISQTQTGDKFFTTYDRDFNRADAYKVSSGVTAITDADILAGLTAAQLVGRAQVSYWTSGNAVCGRVAITAFDGTDTITLSGTATPHSGWQTGADNRRWNLYNCAPKLTRGTYATIDNGDGTLTIYLYPYAANPSAASLDASISYGARDGIIDGQNASNVTIEGLRLLGCVGSASKEDGKCIKFAHGSNSKRNITIRHCLIGNVDTTYPGAYGTVFMESPENLTIYQNSFKNMGNCQAVFLNATSSSSYGQNIVVRQNYFERGSEAGFKFYSQRNVQFVFNECRQTGRGSHSNAWNFYTRCSRILVYGNKHVDVVGYGTWQDSDNLFIGMNLQQVNADTTDSGRALQDQQRTSGTYVPTPNPPSEVYVWNNHFLPHPNAPGSSNALSLGKPWRAWSGTDNDHPFNQRVTLCNNIIHGGGVAEPYITLESWEQRWHVRLGYAPSGEALNWTEKVRDYNLYTATTYWQSGQYGWSKNAYEVVASNETVYADAASGNFGAAAGSPRAGMASRGIADIVAAARATFPDFDGFGMDCDGYPIEQSAPGIGCFLHDYEAQITGIMG
jgi:hypothetical protein